MAFLERAALEELGFAELGENVLISECASIYNPGNIALGNNLRIDDFCVLSAGDEGIEIGNYIHLGVGVTLIGRGAIRLEDFSNLSSRVAVYSSSDDYSGATLTNPMVPEEYKAVIHEPVRIGRHVIIGSGAVILPGVVLEEGAAVGALSLVTHDCRTFGIYAGAPAKFIKERKRDLLELERAFLKTQSPSQE